MVEGAESIVLNGPGQDNYHAADKSYRSGTCFCITQGLHNLWRHRSCRTLKFQRVELCSYTASDLWDNSHLFLQVTIPGTYLEELARVQEFHFRKNWVDLTPSPQKPSECKLSQKRYVSTKSSICDDLAFSSKKRLVEKLLMSCSLKSFQASYAVVWHLFLLKRTEAFASHTLHRANTSAL